MVYADEEMKLLSLPMGVDTILSVDNLRVCHCSGSSWSGSTLIFMDCSALLIITKWLAFTKKSMVFHKKSMVFHKKDWSTLSTHFVQSLDQVLCENQYLFYLLLLMNSYNSPLIKSLLVSCSALSVWWTSNWNFVYGCTYWYLWKLILPQVEIMKYNLYSFCMPGISDCKFHQMWLCTTDSLIFKRLCIGLLADCILQ